MNLSALDRTLISFHFISFVKGDMQRYITKFMKSSF